MRRIPINIYEYAGQILEQLPKGILLSTRADDKMDTMVIGWGTLGTDWGLPVFTVFVRQSRYTKVLLDKNPEFTINVPLKDADVRRIIGFCGTKSGRDYDKFKEMDLTVVPGEKVLAPAIAQFPITLECKVIYQQDQDAAAIPADIKKRYYPTGDYHTAYTGQIINAYLLVGE
ncbi:flavin reductase family protein [Allobaculum sp. JKK-2023]|uniref:flavin reductase family protein n=1 Tax=Allobaculum sp. JKK-2023 TaxID=3108943 RepID=UPI002B059B5B|nr:flavin reductase family protein [Allobaculum sp. JKK-2023]